MIYIPYNISEERIRPIITKEQALSLIRSIPSIKTSKGKDKQRLLRYKEAMASGRPDVLLPVIMEIWQMNEDTIRKGKPIRKISEATIFREAETMFNCEMGQALGCSASDVPDVIHKMVTTAERQK